MRPFNSLLSKKFLASKTVSCPTALALGIPLAVSLNFMENRSGAMNVMRRFQNEIDRRSAERSSIGRDAGIESITEARSVTERLRSATSLYNFGRPVA
jgi:hypothetical protein